eukprot:687065-Pyramimonas_sp.AAC.1
MNRTRVNQPYGGRGNIPKGRTNRTRRVRCESTCRSRWSGAESYKSLMLQEMGFTRRLGWQRDERE